MTSILSGYRRLAPPLRLAIAGAALLGVMAASQPWSKGIAALLLFALALADPAPWPYLAVFCMPFSFLTAQTGRLRVSPADIAVWAAFAGWFGQRLPGGFSRDHRSHWITADFAVALLAVGGAISLAVTRDRIAGFDSYRLLIIQPALLYVVVRFGRSTETNLQRLADAFVLGGVALAALGLWHYFGVNFVERAEGVRRLLVPFYDSPNHISLYLGRTASLAFCLAAFGAAPPRRLAHAVAFGVMMSAIYLTYSRAAWLLGLPAAAAVIAVAAFRRPISRRDAGGAADSKMPASPRARNSLLAAAALALALLALIPVLGTPRFASLLNPEGGTTGSRLLIWQGATRMIAAHPLLGVGIGNFYAQYPRYMLPEAWREPLLYHAHNAVLDFWSMLGIIGVAAFGWLEVAFWRMALRLRRAPLSRDARALLLGLMAGMAYALAHSLVDTLYFLPDLALAFMLTLGMVAALEQRTSA